MRRRSFLRMAGAASLAPVALDRLERTAAPSSAATVLYDDRSIALDRTGSDPTHAADARWVRGQYFNLTAFAKKAGQSVVAEPGARVWSFGEMQALGGGFTTSRVAPDFVVPDRAGRRVHLSHFRGIKVLDRFRPVFP